MLYRCATSLSSHGMLWANYAKMNSSKCLLVFRFQIYHEKFQNKGTWNTLYLHGEKSTFPIMAFEEEIRDIAYGQ